MATAESTVNIMPLEGSNNGANDNRDPRLSLYLTEIGIDVRTTNSLSEKGIDTVYDLLYSTRQRILGIPNIGKPTLGKILEALDNLGFKQYWALNDKGEVSIGSKKYVGLSAFSYRHHIDEQALTSAVLEAGIVPFGKGADGNVLVDIYPEELVKQLPILKKKKKGA